MGKHNGKARATGIRVGQALARRVGGKGGGGAGAGRHTTEVGGGVNMQSVLERNDLDELMAMADLAERDFTAEKANVIVISGGTVDSVAAAEASAARRAASEARHAHELSIPRRPFWDATTTPEQLDAQEKAAFLDWRRRLALLEEKENLLLTPFERNLEVWRQLWRVLERSDVVVQVVDARDPLVYFSADLAAAATELHPSKHTLVLLNKSDLLPPPVRAAWARYFRERGVACAFWSAAAAAEAQLKAKQDAALEAAALTPPSRTPPQAPPRSPPALPGGASASAGGSADEDDSWLAAATQILGVDQLLELMEAQAASAVAASDPDDPRRAERGRRHMVGLVGFPNVGKSSTINAIVGSKKTAVAPTPGKTKHFQTINVSASVCLCDCPGLVLPRFARSKSDMVAAGVIPIDRLTDVRSPVQVVADRCGAAQISDVYGLRGLLEARWTGAAAGGPSKQGAAVGGSAGAAAQAAPLTAARVLLALAVGRGWTAGGGLPDEARAGRQILKDYTAGKLLYCQLPPGSSPPCWAPEQAPSPAWLASLQQLPSGHTSAATAPAQATAEPTQEQQLEQASSLARGSSSSEASDGSVASSSSEVGEDAGGGDVDAAEVAAAEGAILLDAADLELLDALEVEGAGAASAPVQPRRPDYKYQRKPVKGKSTRRGGRDAEEAGYDGAALVTGRKGGLVRVGVF